MFSRIIRNLPRSETIVALMAIRKDSCSINFPRRCVSTQPRPIPDHVAPLVESISVLLVPASPSVYIRPDSTKAATIFVQQTKLSSLALIKLLPSNFVAICDHRHLRLNRSRASSGGLQHHCQEIVMSSGAYSVFIDQQAGGG